jgi:pimeloyl-ACP methyl ester carboxylesterase
VRRLEDAAGHPAGAPALDLVAHGVGQGGHRPSGGHEVPVAVQQPVQLPQRQRTMAAEDREAGDPQIAPADGLRSLGGRRERAAVDIGRAPPLRPWHGWVQLLTEVGERIDDGPALLGRLQEVGIDRRQAVDQGIPLGLQVDPRPQPEPGGPPEVVDRAAPERIRGSTVARRGRRQIGVGHGRLPFVQVVSRAAEPPSAVGRGPAARPVCWRGVTPGPAHRCDLGDRYDRSRPPPIPSRRRRIDVESTPTCIRGVSRSGSHYLLATGRTSAQPWSVPFVDSGAARVAYAARGDGPAVLLLHAGVTDRRSWAPVVDRLGDRVRSIAYDRRGFGETTYEPEPHCEMDDALAVLEAASAARAVVIGSSDGGRRAVDLALAHPDRVAALILISSGVSGAPDEDPSTCPSAVQALYAAYEAAEAGDDLDGLNRIEAHAWLDGWAAEEGRVTGPARDRFLDMNGLALRAPDAGPEKEVEPAWDRLGSIRVPTLVLCGDLDVLCTSVSDHLVAQIPDARHEELRSTGHLPHLEAHPRALEVIADFVDAVAS